MRIIYKYSEGISLEQSTHDNVSSKQMKQTEKRSNGINRDLEKTTTAT